MPLALSAQLRRPLLLLLALLLPLPPLSLDGAQIRSLARAAACCLLPASDLVSLANFELAAAADER